MQYVRIQPDDHASIQARAELHILVQHHDQPYVPGPSPHVLSVQLAYPSPGADHEHWLAYRDDTLVGLVELDLPTLENLDNAAVGIFVHPQHRRSGLGRQLAEFSFGRARSNGRRRAIAEICEGLVGDPDHDSAGVRLGHALGAQRALPEVRRRLQITQLARSEVERLLASAEEASTAYHLVPWSGPVPEEVIDGIATLETRMVADAPMGDLVWETENYDATRWRAIEGALAGRRSRMHGCASVHTATAEVTGFTTCTIEADVPEHASQWTTIVLPWHRGHRLGLRLKAHNQLRLLDAEPELRTVDTWNSPENAPMIAVNEALGYRALDRWSEWQIELD